MIATPQLTEPPAPDLIGRPERNGGGDRGRQSALACRWMHGRCMTLLAASQKSQKKNSVPGFQSRFF